MFPLAEARAASERTIAREKRDKVVHRVADEIGQEHKAFAALHEGGPFVLATYGAGCARVLSALGFNALATTSSALPAGSAASTAATLDETVEHAAALDRATELSLSVDPSTVHGPRPSRRGALDLARAAVRAVGYRGPMTG